VTTAASIRVLTLADNSYAMPLAVMGRSLLENHRSGRSLLLKVIDGGISPANREHIEKSWRGATTCPASWEWVAPVFGKARTLPVWGRVPALTYARLFLDSYFEPAGFEPAGDGRVILLDSDTLVLADLAELQDSTLDEAVMGACVDPFIPTISSIDGLPRVIRSHLPDDTPYFNAGIMVADLRRWREERVGERTLEYIEREHRRLRQYDQDALNAVLAGRWKKLDGSWNTQPRTPNALGIPLPPNPRIVHFSGSLKPWQYDGGTEPDRLFREYLQRTDWAAYVMPRTWQARACKLYDSPLRRLLHPLECRMFALRRKLILSRRDQRPGVKTNTSHE
jgi:lipopolysaccharide biosynthesis glycosyltransferase